MFPGPPQVTPPSPPKIETDVNIAKNPAVALGLGTAALGALVAGGSSTTDAAAAYLEAISALGIDPDLAVELMVAVNPDSEVAKAAALQLGIVPTIESAGVISTVWAGPLGEEAWKGEKRRRSLEGGAHRIHPVDQSIHWTTWVEQDPPGPMDGFGEELFPTRLLQSSAAGPSPPPSTTTRLLQSSPPGSPSSPKYCLPLAHRTAIDESSLLNMLRIAQWPWPSAQLAANYIAIVLAELAGQPVQLVEMGPSVSQSVSWQALKVPDFLDWRSNAGYFDLDPESHVISPRLIDSRIRYESVVNQQKSFRVLDGGVGYVAWEGLALAGTISQFAAEQRELAKGRHPGYWRSWLDSGGASDGLVGQLPQVGGLGRYCTKWQQVGLVDDWWTLSSQVGLLDDTVLATVGTSVAGIVSSGFCERTCGSQFYGKVAVFPENRINLFCYGLAPARG